MRYLTLSLIALMLLTLTGCGSRDTRPPSSATLSFTTANLNLLPPALQTWAGQHREEEGVFLLNQDDRTYLLASAGQRPNTGYQIAITKVISSEDGLEVVVDEQHPVPGTSTGSVITYPQAIIQLPRTNLPVHKVTRNIRYAGQ